VRIAVICAACLTETWFKGKKDEREVPVLNLMDADRTHKEYVVKQTFDYALAADEVDEYDLAELEGSKFTLWVGLIKFTDGGRMRVNGRIDKSTVPVTALRKPNIPSTREASGAVANGSAAKTPSQPLATAGGR